MFVTKDLKKRPLDPIKEYPCKFCKQVMLRVGAFNPLWPNRITVRAMGAWRKEEIAIKVAYSSMYPGRPVAFIYHMKCKYCGTDNVITCATSNAISESHIKADYDMKRDVNSPFINAVSQKKVHLTDG